MSNSSVKRRVKWMYVRPDAPFGKNTRHHTNRRTNKKGKNEMFQEYFSPSNLELKVLIRRNGVCQIGLKITTSSSYIIHGEVAAADLKSIGEDFWSEIKTKPTKKGRIKAEDVKQAFSLAINQNGGSVNEL